MGIYHIIRKTLPTILSVLAPLINAGAQTETPFSGGRTELSFSIPDARIEVGYTYVKPVPTDTIRLTIVGDVMMHKAQLENCKGRYAQKYGSANPSDPSNYDFTPCLAPICDILESADVCVANMEFTHSGPPFTGYPAFSAPESWSSYIADCGVDVFLMANNHILDGGPRGAERTGAVYEDMAERGVKHTGCFADEADLEANQPLILECRGVKIGIVNFTYGTNVPPTTIWPKVCGSDREEIASAMKKAREDADIVIVIPHWGEEYQLRHSQWQDEMAAFLLRNGADAIVGAHPHVVQDVETRTTPFGKKVPIAYSLGNIISNMSATNTQIGLIATLPLVRYSDGSTALAEPEYTFTWCSLPGRLTNCHTTIPVRDWLNRRDEWENPADYDKMLSTYERILGTSGIQLQDLR
ncbi:MAG: CapA family protein [Bacteroidales bacterium]|nr:CapA family protein [Bacteroidales bacterium]